MTLPIRIPCHHCRGDRLFVWDRERRRWRCNDCGKERIAARPCAGDAYMRRKAIKGTRKRNGPARASEVPTDG